MIHHAGYGRYNGVGSWEILAHLFSVVFEACLGQFYIKTHGGRYICLVMHPVAVL